MPSGQVLPHGARSASASSSRLDSRRETSDGLRESNIFSADVRSPGRRRRTPDFRFFGGGGGPRQGIDLGEVASRRGGTVVHASSVSRPVDSRGGAASRRAARRRAAGMMAFGSAL